MNTCKKGKLIEIDRKGFEIWKNMSKEVMIIKGFCKYPLIYANIDFY